MENTKHAPIAVDPEGGEILSVVGGNYRVLISGKQTNGAFATIEMLVPPKNGPGPHSHANFYESFFILEGEVEVHSEAGSYTAKKDSFVVVPQGGIVHYFKNVSDKLARLLCIVVPSGLEEFFEEIGTPVAFGEFIPPQPMDTESIKQIQAIAQKHGQILYPPDFLENK
ncbi:cupin domain-containing protein [Dyadobacter sp. CY326]|uniref:cupin domain-containing protein n=1 Tax=Dyadobacter sp. CY326 TaxID=2907300 RepID=UPI001F1C66D8|nr:cupin domain-containing protein [Dyadobacter sp. CY326]MCE7065778.1 cupin domain-containing protein [Dyadobacter sp. CY326]